MLNCDSERRGSAISSVVSILEVAGAAVIVADETFSSVELVQPLMRGLDRPDCE